MQYHGLSCFVVMVGEGGAEGIANGVSGDQRWWYRWEIIPCGRSETRMQRAAFGIPNDDSPADTDLVDTDSKKKLVGAQESRKKKSQNSSVDGIHVPGWWEFD